MVRSGDVDELSSPTNGVNSDEILNTPRIRQGNVKFEMELNLVHESRRSFT